MIDHILFVVSQIFGFFVISLLFFILDVLQIERFVTFQYRFQVFLLPLVVGLLYEILRFFYLVRLR